VGRCIFGVDVRHLGSGNAGGTNTLRTLGWRAALPVMAVDVGKGVLAGLLPRLAGANEPAWLPAACAMLAVLGHCYPVLASFRGGKGVATGGGAVAVLAPWAALACAVVWGVTVALTRLVSLASILAALALPFVVWLLDDDLAPGLSPLAVALALLVVWTHRTNIGRLLRREEPRITVGKV
jgi:acyl phosphate:glycerol-3-phosphate acyltransferase